jgi:hypothetical protein
VRELCLVRNHDMAASPRKSRAMFCREKVIAATTNIEALVECRSESTLKQQIN